MALTLKQPTLNEFKAWAKAHKSLAYAVCKAQAYAETKREQVDKYIKPIFDRYAFKKDLEILKDKPDYMEPLTEMDDLYLTDDARLPAYYEDCDQAHRAHGFDGPKGYCPALIAENLYIQAQNALLDCAEELIGIEASDVYGENREKLLKLLIGACVKGGK